MVGNFFNFGEDPKDFTEMIKTCIPNIPGWIPKRLSTPQEAMTVALALKALNSAGIRPDLFEANTWIPKGEEETLPIRVGLGITSTLGPYQIYTRIGKDELTEKNALEAARIGIPGDAHTAVIDALNLHGPSNILQNACATALFQIDIAVDQLRLGKAELAIAGGYEIGPAMAFHGILFASGAYAPFAQYGSHPEDASRPVDRSPAGMVSSEGGVVFMLATDETIKRLGLPPDCRLVEIKSTAIGQDPNRLTPQGKPRDLPRVLNEALKRAGITFSDLDLVIPHDTGTKAGGIHDYASLRQIAGLPARLFDDPPDVSHPGLPYISSSKGNTGHLLAASGGIAMIAGIESIKRQEIFPTRNVFAPNGMIFNPVHGSTLKTKVNNVMTFAEGIAGETAAIVFSRV